VFSAVLCALSREILTLAFCIFSVQLRVSVVFWFLVAALQRCGEILFLLAARRAARIRENLRPPQVFSLVLVFLLLSCNFWADSASKS
jgi:hypothetical protein